MDLAFLTGLTTAIIELIKSTFKAFGWFNDDDQREAIVRWLAAIVGVIVALAFQYDPLHAVPTLAGMVASGLALGIASDLLHVGFDLGKAKADELQARADSPTTMSSTLSASVSPAETPILLK